MRVKIWSSDADDELAAGVTLIEGGGTTRSGRGGEMQSVEMCSREGGDMMNRLDVVRLRVFVDG